jgi:acyl-CoA synthetase (AMP-forming)/AMP-acid ligase II
MTFPQVAGQRISWAAVQHGARTALVHGDRTLSFAETEARTNRLANGLLHLGLAPGDRLAVLLNNCMDSVVSVFAAEKAAQTYVALNSRHTVQEHAGILNDAQANTVILGPEFAALAGPLREHVPSLRHVIVLGGSIPGAIDYERVLASGGPNPPDVLIAADHLVRIAYTSGTTGRPKGVAYTVQRLQQQLTNQFYAMEYALGIDDAMLHVGPLTHAAGVYLLPCYLRGARSVIADRFDPETMLRDIQKHRITQLMLVPTMLARLLDVLDTGIEFDLSSLRRINYGTAPAPVELLQRALGRFGPILRQQYGMTEAVQPLAILYPHEHLIEGAATQRSRLASCGKPTINVAITIRGPVDQALPQGEIGEIAIEHRGIGAVQFWRQPEITAESIRNGRYYTGDLGYFDAEGYLYIVGRNKEMIISGGFNVSVLGIPDPEWGELVAAFVVPRADSAVTVEELASHCAQRIAGYKKPRVLRVVAELPRNNSGKVTKHVLREGFLQETEKAKVAA